MRCANTHIQISGMYKQTTTIATTTKINKYSYKTVKHTHTHTHKHTHAQSHAHMHSQRIAHIHTHTQLQTGTVKGIPCYQQVRRISVPVKMACASKALKWVCIGLKEVDSQCTTHTAIKICVPNGSGIAQWLECWTRD